MPPEVAHQNAGLLLALLLHQGAGYKPSDNALYQSFHQVDQYTAAVAYARSDLIYRGQANHRQNAVQTKHRDERPFRH